MSGFIAKSFESPDDTAGMAYVIEPGHDAWVVGDQPAIAFEFDSSTAQTFAQPT